MPIDDHTFGGVYRRAPLRFVACAVHFPMLPRLLGAGTKQAVQERLAASFPLSELLAPAPVSGGGERLRGGLAMPEKLRMTNRERTCSVTIGPRIVLLERSEHDCFEGLGELLGRVLRALAIVAAPVAVSEVSLRYVNEIRHPSVRAAGDWRGLLHDAFIGPVNLLGAAAEHASTAAVYRLPGAREVRVVSGAESEGFLVDPEGPLYVRPAAAGPFFGLDLAAEWSAPRGPLPPFGVEHVLRIARELHAPLRELFERAITDELRAHFAGTDRGLAPAGAKQPRAAAGAEGVEHSEASYLPPSEILWAEAGVVNERSAPDRERDEQDLRVPAVRKQLSELLRRYEQLEGRAQLDARRIGDPPGGAAGRRTRPGSADAEPRFITFRANLGSSPPPSPPRPRESDE
ncbi:MAG TPA: TIGR04255 family protein [Solirubrobacteraceae bacterium]|nr:TIGR04255 family protein [Solirubrobacteraceae bacterium]